MRGGGLSTRKLAGNSKGLRFRLSVDWQRQRDCILDSLTFDNGVDLVGVKVAELFQFAVGPANFHSFYFWGSAQAEMQAQIVLRKIAGAAAYFVELHHTG